MTMYLRGDLVWVRKHGQWERGIATDVFTGCTGREVVVVGGDGYYADDDVVADIAVAVEPQSRRVNETLGELS
jgi:hypothetical protein